jgi:hypothetical protein
MSSDLISASNRASAEIKTLSVGTASAGKLLFHIFDDCYQLQRISRFLWNDLSEFAQMPP